MKDINEYFEISQNICDRIAGYWEEGISNDEIEDKMSRDLQMGTDLINLVFKNKKE